MPKGRVGKVKRRLVRQAVRENLALIRGLDPAVLRRETRRRQARRRMMALAALPVGLAVSSFAISTSLGGSPAPGAGRSLPPEAVVSHDGGGPGLERPDAPGLAGEEAAPGFAGLEVVPPRASLDPEVFPLAVRRVIIDPGHGGESLGTRTPLGLVEKEVTLDIGRRLARLLSGAGFEVHLTRDRDRFVPLEERARLANEAAADIFISIHVNWIEDRSTRGVETYYLGATDDPYVNRLAAEENRDSGYSMADLRHLLERIYGDLRNGKSRDLASEIQASLYRSLSKVSPELRDRGVKTAPFIVLVDTEMPAILAEVACLSNDREADLLGKPLYREYIAEALAKGIQGYADGPALAGQKGS